MAGLPPQGWSALRLDQGSQFLGGRVAIARPVERAAGRVDEFMGQLQLFSRGRNCVEFALPSRGGADLRQVLQHVQDQPSAGGTDQNQLAMPRQDDPAEADLAACPQGALLLSRTGYFIIRS